MNYNEEKEALCELGFNGFITVSDLMHDINAVPTTPGVYAVMRKNDDKPTFLNKGTGGFFKGKDPNVDIEKLQHNWVDDTSIVYFGKAGGQDSKSTLRKRLKQYMDFGQGEPVGHKGGRYIWQLVDAKDLVVCWKKVSDGDPRDVENKLIVDFKEKHNGQRPFANLRD